MFQNFSVSVARSHRHVANNCPAANHTHPSLRGYLPLSLHNTARTGYTLTFLSLRQRERGDWEVRKGNQANNSI